MGVSAQSIFSALCDILPDLNLKCKTEKIDVSGILCTKATLLEDNIFSKSDYAFAQNICENILKDENFDQSIFCAINKLLTIISPDYIISSPIFDGSGFADGICIPSPKVLQMLKDLKIPYETLKIQKHLAKCDGIALVKYLANDFGTLAKMEIDKIGYGTDNERIVRVVTGFDETQSILDLFEMSDELFYNSEISYCTK